MKVSEKVVEKIKPLFTGDIRLVEVEYVKKVDGMHLVVYIDKEGGVNINDCVAVNELIDEPIEELNPTDDAPYVLDVSSYGLDRPLKYDWQFKRYEGKKIAVKLYKKLNGKKDFVAVLASHDDKGVVLKTDDGNLELNFADIAQILPYIEFEEE